MNENNVQNNWVQTEPDLEVFDLNEVLYFRQETSEDGNKTDIFAVFNERWENAKSNRSEIFIGSRPRTEVNFFLRGIIERLYNFPITP